jgi:hypothetical protein
MTACSRQIATGMGDGGQRLTAQVKPFAAKVIATRKM